MDYVTQLPGLRSNAIQWETVRSYNNFFTRAEAVIDDLNINKLLFFYKSIYFTLVVKIWYYGLKKIILIFPRISLTSLRYC